MKKNTLTQAAIAAMAAIPLILPIGASATTTALTHKECKDVFTSGEGKSFCNRCLALTGKTISMTRGDGTQPMVLTLDGLVGENNENIHSYKCSIGSNTGGDQLQTYYKSIDGDLFSGPVIDSYGDNCQITANSIDSAAGGSVTIICDK